MWLLIIPNVMNDRRMMQPNIALILVLHSKKFKNKYECNDVCSPTQSVIEYY
jgi:hypothetical protein